MTGPLPDFTRYTEIIVAMDSFKGCMDSEGICSLVAEEMGRYSGRRIKSFPIADGGEGTARILGRYRGCRVMRCSVSGAYGEAVEADWYLDEKGRIAYLDTATVLGSGLKHRPLNPLIATSTGVGTLLNDVLRHFPEKIVIGLGGVSTVDGGKGMLEALGMDKADTCVETVGGRFEGMECVALSDVTNPLLGENGAARVYGPQKGADGKDIEVLERRNADLARRIGGKDWRKFAEAEGAGAAGGIGFALSLLGFRLEPGARYIVDVSGIERYIDSDTLVITGEGCSDATTLMGKAAMSVLELAKRKGADVWLLSGRIKDEELLRAAGFSYITQLMDTALPLSVNMQPSQVRINLGRSLTYE